MSVMIKLSLLLNLAVLIPITLGFATNAGWLQEAYGPVSPARGILFSVYFTIMAASAILLFVPDVKFIVALLSLQILYKVTTPITVGAIDHPVVLSNLAIAAFHTVTLWLIWSRYPG